MHRLTSDHWTAIKCLFQYLCGTSNHGLVLYHNYSFSLHAFSNVDWASNRDEIQVLTSSTLVAILSYKV